MYQESAYQLGVMCDLWIYLWILGYMEINKQLEDREEGPGVDQ